MRETALEVVRGVYDAFGRGDVVALLERVDPAVVWRTPEGLPGGGTYHGREGVGEFVGRVTNSAEALTIDVTRWIVAGEGTVVVEGVDVWVHGGRTLRNPFAHVWDVGDGRVTALSEYTDVAPVRAMLDVPG